MIIIHSFWTKPLMANREKLKANLYLYALSLHYAKQHASEIILHTDNFGALLLKDFGYTQIKTTLDVLENEHPIFYSHAKILAIQNEPLGSIHIDGDVLLKNGDYLDFTNFDAIVQGEEKSGILMKHYLETRDILTQANLSLPIGYDPELPYSLNMGVIGFNDSQLKTDYINGYFSILNQCKNSNFYMDKLFSNGKAPLFEPNIVIEQYFFAGLSKTKNIKKILPIPAEIDGELETVEIMNQTANQIGYCHLWGQSKYDNIETVKNSLQQKNQNLFQTVNDIINGKQN